MEDVTSNEKTKRRQSLEVCIYLIRRSYNNPLFIDYLWKPIEESNHPTKEFIQLLSELESVIEQKWQDFQITNVQYKKEIINKLLEKNYNEYKRWNVFQEFLYESIDISKRPLDTFLKIKEELEKADRNPPYGWQACLTRYLSRDLIERLEALRVDPHFNAYVELKKKWLENVKNKAPRGTDEEIRAFENHKQYLEFLPMVQRWIMKQLYFQFLNVNQAKYLKFLESEVAKYKAKK